MISALSTNNWVTITIILMMGILVVLNYLYEIRFSKFISLTQVNEYFVDYLSKSSSIFNLFYLFLFVFQISTYSLLIVKIHDFLIKNTVQNSFLLFLRTALFLIVFYALRYLVGILIALILEMKREQDLLTFIKMSYLSKTAILIFPAIIILYYFPFLNDIIFKIILLIIITVLVFKYLQILKQNQKLIFSNLFYFILYLCALEITPLIYLFRLFINKG